MKKIIQFVIIFVVYNSSLAQQTTQFTHHVFNAFETHPALAGIKGCVDVRLGYRTQWVGFQGAPRTMFANAHGALPSKYKHLKSKHGVGLRVETDNAGLYGRTQLHAAYAYHFPLSRELMMSAGFFAGFVQQKFDATLIFAQNYNDNSLNAGNTKIIWPVIDPGVWIYNTKFFAGFTLQQMLRNRMKNIGQDSRYTHHYILTAGTRFKPENGNGEWTFMPSANLKFAPMSKPAIDVNFLAEYKKTIIVGATWRNIDAVAALFRINFLKYFSLAYAFDYTTSRIKISSANSHEIILGISACPHRGQSSYDCPVF